MGIMGFVKNQMKKMVKCGCCGPFIFLAFINKVIVVVVVRSILPIFSNQKMPNLLFFVSSTHLF